MTMTQIKFPPGPQGPRPLNRLALARPHHPLDFPLLPEEQELLMPYLSMAYRYQRQRS